MDASHLKKLNPKEKIDYKKVGLKCGIEIHQQLNTNKLFCTCPCEIMPNETLTKQVERKLRFSLSETGTIDKAAYDEFKKNKSNIYKYNDKTACLIDLDEEPPKGPNQKAFDTAIKMGLMCNIKFFDKAQFMRKIIIDGSVTSGYQRTSMLGFGGDIKTSFGKVGIEGINIEEDSCRTLERTNSHTIFSLDRLGIPLIEITTAPDIKTPEQAYEVAYQLGNMLRSFEETKRGLGTIRQDINVSITGGARIEIKGAQNLKLIPQIINAEIKRQQIYLSILEELKSRNINLSNFTDKKIYDITKLFKKTTSKIILENLKGENKKVLVIKLNKFKNILGHELHENYRFATEISDRNKKHFPEIKGLFHSDELPKYGITEEEVNNIHKELKNEKQDSFILIANEENTAKKSLKNVIEIIKELITEIPSEVRQVDPKGTLTTFSRPMPGSARMYPETDIKEVEVSQEYLNSQKKNLPELYDQKIKRLTKKFKLDEQKIITILNQFSIEEFEDLLKTRPRPVNIYQIIIDLPKEIKKREKIKPIKLDTNLLKEILKLSAINKLNKNSLYNLHVNLYKENISNLDNLEQYLKDKNLIAKQVDEKEIEAKIKQIIKNNPKAPFGALMGICMQEFNGQVEGKIISEILKKSL